jgi:hypothetical protein
MEFVSDYGKKKKLAEALRGRQKAYAGIETGGPTITTAANGTYPGSVQANWAGALGQLASGFLSGRAGKQADAAEEEQRAARMAALTALTGKEAPAELLSTGEELDMPALQSKALERLLPDKAAFGAVSQAMLTPQGIRLAQVRGEITPEEADQAIKDLDTTRTNAFADYEKKARLDASLEYHAPPASNSSDFEKWLYQNDRPAWELRFGKSGTGAGGKGGRYDPKREADKLGTVADQLNSLIEEHGAEMFSPFQKAAKIGQEYGQENPGELIPKIMQAAGTTVESPANTAMRTLGIETALQSIAQLAPASDADIRLILSKMPNAYNSEAGAREVISLMKEVQRKFYAGQYGDETAPPAGAEAPQGGGIGTIINAGGKKYRIIGGDPNDPDVEEVP